MNAVIPGRKPLAADSDSDTSSRSFLRHYRRILEADSDSDIPSPSFSRQPRRILTIDSDSDTPSRSFSRRPRRNLRVDSDSDTPNRSSSRQPRLILAAGSDSDTSSRSPSRGPDDDFAVRTACLNRVATGGDKSDETDDDVPVSKLQAMGYSTACIREVKARRKRLKKGKQAESTTGGLCSNCSKITIDAIRSGFSISNSFSRLKRSADICQLCRIVLMCLRNHLPEIDEKLENSKKKTSVAVKFDADGATDTADPGWHTYIEPKVPLLETFKLSMGDSEKGIIQVDARISLAPGGKKNENRLRLLDIHSYIMIYTKDANTSTRWSLPLDPRPKRDCKYAMMRRWLEVDMTRSKIFLNSFTSPSDGANPDHETSFPRRLIYVPPSLDAEPFQLRLMNSEQLLKTKTQDGSPSYPGYVILSHRWGLVHHFTTTKASLSSREEGFTLDDLPRTYRDAAIVASKLGVSYLWIDAACIVQDDPEEWLCESEKMGMIYRSAVCTIASHCSESDDAGFLDDALRKTRGSIAFSLEGTYLRPAADLELDVSKSPLSKRGWILQERFLSTRVLHFTTGMIYLETSEGVKSEDGDAQGTLMQTTVDSVTLLTAEQFLYRKPLSLQSFSKILNETPKKQENSFGTTSPQSPLEWFSLLEMYTTCSLTKEEDKLTAISGIAKICCQKFDSAYLAGVWADRLAIGLMWMNVGGLLRAPSSPRASSWAWSAYDGPIQFPLSRHYGLFTTTCTLLHVEASNPSWLNGPGALTIEVDLLDLSPILLSGHLMISRYREALYPQNSKAWEAGAPQEPFRPPFIKLFDMFNVRQYIWAPWTIESQFHQRDGGWMVFDTENRLLNQEDYRMPLSFASLAYFRLPDNLGPPLSVHMCIFLIPAGSDNTYRRVGAGIIRDSLLAGLQRHGATLASQGLDLAQPYEFQTQRITLI